MKGTLLSFLMLSTTYAGTSFGDLYFENDQHLKGILKNSRMKGLEKESSESFLMQQVFSPSVQENIKTNVFDMQVENKLSIALYGFGCGGLSDRALDKTTQKNIEETFKKDAAHVSSGFYAQFLTKNSSRITACEEIYKTLYPSSATNITRHFNYLKDFIKNLDNVKKEENATGLAKKSLKDIISDYVLISNAEEENKILVKALWQRLAQRKEEADYIAYGSLVSLLKKNNEEILEAKVHLINYNLNDPTIKSLEERYSEEEKEQLEDFEKNIEFLKKTKKGNLLSMKDFVESSKILKNLENMKHLFEKMLKEDANSLITPEFFSELAKVFSPHYDMNKDAGILSQEATCVKILPRNVENEFFSINSLEKYIKIFQSLAKQPAQQTVTNTAPPPPPPPPGLLNNGTMPPPPPPKINLNSTSTSGTSTSGTSTSGTSTPVKEVISKQYPTPQAGREDMLEQIKSGRNVLKRTSNLAPTQDQKKEKFHTNYHRKGMQDLVERSLYIVYPELKEMEEEKENLTKKIELFTNLEKEKTQHEENKKIFENLKEEEKTLLKEIKDTNITPKDIEDLDKLEETIKKIELYGKGTETDINGKEVPIKLNPDELRVAYVSAVKAAKDILPKGGDLQKQHENRVGYKDCIKQIKKVAGEKYASVDVYKGKLKEKESLEPKIEALQKQLKNFEKLEKEIHPEISLKEQINSLKNEKLTLVHNINEFKEKHKLSEKEEKQLESYYSSLLLYFSELTEEDLKKYSQHTIDILKKRAMPSSQKLRNDLEKRNAALHPEQQQNNTQNSPQKLAERMYSNKNKNVKKNKLFYEEESDEENSDED